MQTATTTTIRPRTAAIPLPTQPSLFSEVALPLTSALDALAERLLAKNPFEVLMFTFCREVRERQAGSGKSALTALRRTPTGPRPHRRAIIAALLAQLAALQSLPQAVAPFLEP